MANDDNENSLPVENPFEVAAKRVRNAVKPEGGRKEGEFTKQFTESSALPSAIALKLLTGPFYAAGDIPGFVNEFMGRTPGSDLSKEEVERGFNAAALTGAGAGIGRVTSEMRLPKVAGKAAPIAEDQALLDHIIERGKEFSPEEQARQQRMQEQGYNTDAYHGTFVPEFDAFKTRENDIGSHFGTSEQANDILRNVDDKPRILPVKLKIENPLRLEDKGDWSFNTIKNQLIKNKIASKEEINNINNKYFSEKDKTTALNKFIRQKGYDSIIYKNRHEGVPSDVQNAINDTGKSIHELNEKELAKYPEIKDSYIPLNPANIRGKFAKFDPANEGQNMIMGLKQNKLNPNNPVEINAAPNMPQRPLSADYKNLRFIDVPNGIIQNDIEGRPLTAPIVAGRRIVGSSDQGLSSADIHRVATEGVETTINPTPRSQFAPGEAGSYNTRKNKNAPEHLTERNIKFNMALDNLMRDRVIAHEVAHGIEHRSVGDDPWFAGGGYHISSKNMRDEMYRVYNDMNNENPAMIGKNVGLERNLNPEIKNIITRHKGGDINDVNGLKDFIDKNINNLSDNEIQTINKHILNKSHIISTIPEGMESPELRGYSPQKVPRELWAESIRAYMDNPNYMKTVAPETAKAIRQMVNSNQQLSKVIQFNAEGSVPGVALAALYHGSLTKGLEEINAGSHIGTRRAAKERLDYLRNLNDENRPDAVARQEIQRPSMYSTDFKPKNTIKMGDMGDWSNYHVAQSLFDDKIINKTEYNAIKAGTDYVSILKDKGYDAIEYKNDREHKGSTSYITLKNIPVKPDEKFTSFNAEGSVPGAAIAALSKPFYSAVENAIKGAKQSTANADQWLGTIKNSPGIKQEELNWTGLEDYIKSKDGKISKQELQDYMDNHKVELNEVNKGTSENLDNLNKAKELAASHGHSNWDDLGPAMQRRYQGYIKANEFQNNPKYSQYQLPSGENYREKLLTLKNQKVPTSEEFSKQFYENWVRKGGQPDWEKLSIDEKEEIHQITRQYDSEKKGLNNYQSSHWDEPNVLAHVRMNDRNIPDVGKTLHLEEIQSDWHQAGREKGYQPIDTSGWTVTRETHKRQWGPPGTYEAFTVHDKNGNKIGRFDDLPNEVAAIRMAKEYKESSFVPNAPFKSTWPDLVLKRMIREASEKDYDAISWSPGEVQNKRYPGRGIKEEEGMKEFYDKILVNKVNQLAKKFGGKVELKDLNGTKLAIEKTPEGQYAINDPNDIHEYLGIFDTKSEAEEFLKEEYNIDINDKKNSTNIHVLKLTKELKDAALNKGFPLFSSAHPGMMFTPIDNHPDNHKLIPINHDPFAGE